MCWPFPGKISGNRTVSEFNLWQAKIFQTELYFEMRIKQRGMGCNLESIRKRKA